MSSMRAETRIYLDAVLQNIKSVSFFTFLGVLIARLGASDFEIALSNSLPAFFCALSLAFLTRQLPVTRGVFLVSGSCQDAASHEYADRLFRRRSRNRVRTLAAIRP